MRRRGQRLEGQRGKGDKAERCGWLRDLYGVAWKITPTVLMDMRRFPDTDRKEARRPSDDEPCCEEGRAARAAGASVSVSQSLVPGTQHALCIDEARASTGSGAMDGVQVELCGQRREDQGNTDAMARLTQHGVEGFMQSNEGK